MRRHKTVAQIFLFLSIVSFTFAGIAQQQTPTISEMRVDLVTGAEGAEERGHAQSRELPEWLERPSTAEHHLHPRFDPRDLESRKFFSAELNRKMKEYLVLGAIAGVFTGIANGMQKQILGSVSPNAYVFYYYYYDLLHPLTPLMPTLG